MLDPKEIVINGCVYNIRDLLQRREQNRENINLRTGVRRSTAVVSRLKYTVEDRAWQAGASLAAIQDRYNLTETQARGIQWQARTALAKLGIDTARAR